MDAVGRPEMHCPLGNLWTEETKIDLVDWTNNQGSSKVDFPLSKVNTAEQRWQQKLILNTYLLLAVSQEVLFSNDELFVFLLLC